MRFLMVFDFTQFWLDGQPGNEYFLDFHPWVCIRSDLKPLFETDMSDSSYSDWDLETCRKS